MMGGMGELGESPAEGLSPLPSQPEAESKTTIISEAAKHPAHPRADNAPIRPADRRRKWFGLSRQDREAIPSGGGSIVRCMRGGRFEKTIVR